MPESFTHLKARLREGHYWVPYPSMISFLLVLIFTSHILFDLNPRIGNPAKVIAFDGEPAQDGGIWVSVIPKGQSLIVTTSERSIFQFNQKIDDVQELMPFVEYLQNRAAQLSLNAGLAKVFDRERALVTIASDQHLTFGHFRPILYALGKAGISSYAFETRTISERRNTNRAF